MFINGKDISVDHFYGYTYEYRKKDIVLAVSVPSLLASPLKYLFLFYECCSTTALFTTYTSCFFKQLDKMDNRSPEMIYMDISNLLIHSTLHVETVLYRCKFKQNLKKLYKVQSTTIKYTKYRSTGGYKYINHPERVICRIYYHPISC